MRSPDRTLWQASPSRLLGSYVTDLNGWVTRLATGYALAIGTLVAGAILILVALGVGAAAFFRWLETHYGPYASYGTLGGLLLLTGILSVVWGMWLLKRPIPPIPRPHRQTRAFKHAIAAPAVFRALATIDAGGAARPDAVTQALAGVAAMALLGWIITSYLRRSSGLDREAK